MAECKHQCIVLKRICIFVLGVLLGFGGGFKYHQSKVEHRIHDRLLKESGKPRRYINKAPEPRKETFFEKKNRVPR
mgnify:FL=1|jgi:hypothetical protein|tara:strand:+ start:386 stop:613 length:228 start_codon:yes stop_codon:yes gene_type:complete